MSVDYVKKFSYRPYTGKKEPRWKRIWSLAYFEMTSSWRKSTIGKILLIILLIVNGITAIGVLSFASFLIGDLNDEEASLFIRQFITEFAGDYFTVIGVVSFGFGWFVIALIAIAGSGFFADDKQGNVIEIYLSRLTRGEYVFGKIFGMIFYANIFTTLPVLAISILYVQGFGMDHLEYLDVYTGLIIYGMIVAFILGLFILVLSTIIDKRAYASLTFVLFYFIASIFGGIASRFGDEYLLLLSPSNFANLLAHSILGLYTVDMTFVSNTPTLLLNDGIGLEYTNVIGFALSIIVILLIFLLIRIRRLTTDNI